MMLVIQTQDYENYGDAVKPYWKPKGGSQYKILGVPSSVDLSSVIDMVRGEIECDNDFFQTSIIGYGLEQDDYMSLDERNQLEFEGRIVYPDPTIEYNDLLASVH